MNRLTVLAAGALAVAGLAACGGDDDTTAASDADSRTIEIAMKDIAFEPDAVEVEVGEIVRFVFENEGRIAHDALVGTEDEQAKLGSHDERGGRHGPQRRR